jgi:hypothetical protein
MNQFGVFGFPHFFRVPRVLLLFKCGGLLIGFCWIFVVRNAGFVFADFLTVFLDYLVRFCGFFWLNFMDFIVTILRTLGCISGSLNCVLRTFIFTSLRSF